MSSLTPLNVAGVYDGPFGQLEKSAVLTLSPAFNKSIFYYTATTENTTNTISAVAMDGEA